MMDIHTATEIAYKNGFKAGQESALRYGKWTVMRDPHNRIIGFLHEECGRASNEASKYCPLCGARMSMEE